MGTENKNDSQKSVIQAANEATNKLISWSGARTAKETNFLTQRSLDYRHQMNSPHATNENVDPKLSATVIKNLTEEADKEIIFYQQQLKNNNQNLDQSTIKEYKSKVKNYFTKVDDLLNLGGFLNATVEDIKGENLPGFITSLKTTNFNGKNERERDLSMFMANGWANNFDTTGDVKVTKDYEYLPNDGDGSKAILKQKIDVGMFTDTFKRYLKDQPYVMEDVLDNKNMVVENGKRYYRIEGELDSTLLENGDIFDVYMTDVPSKMKYGEVFENAGIPQAATLQPQFFLGGKPIDPEVDEPASNNFKTLPSFNVSKNKLYKSDLRFIDTDAINQNPAYQGALREEIEGLFGIGSGNPGVLYGYANNNLGIDLPVGFFEALTNDEKKYYKGLSATEQAGYMGNRYKFNTIDGKTPVSLINSQKAWIMEKLQNKALDIKLQEATSNNEPSFEKITLSDKNQKGRDIIKFLNDEGMPIPKDYKNTLGITEWQAGMATYVQKVPQGFKTLDKKLTPELKEIIKQYS